MLEHGFADAGANQVESSFGRGFADQLAELPTEEWSGPIESAFGLHLVFVEKRTEGRLPALSEVRESVARDWRYTQSEEASKAFYKDLLTRYQVSIEWDTSEPASKDQIPIGENE